MRNKILSVIVFIFFLGGLAFVYYPLSEITFAHAAGASSGMENIVNFDETNVLDDLSSATIDDKPFSLRDYPYDSNAEASMITFVEYCYSADPNKQGNYALYLFIYNPANIYFNTDSIQNKVQLAAEYKTQTDEDGAPYLIASRYEKFELKFCNKSTLSGYQNLFYKFKVTYTGSIISRLNENKVNPSERRYDISGVELVATGKSNAAEYKIEATYRYSGFAAGYGTESSTLSCKVSDLQTVSIDMHHTYYNMPGIAPAGRGHQNQISTVYFSIPNNLISEYGRLQKIHAEWWEYKTSPIVITSNWDVYDNLWYYRGTQTKSSHNPLDIKYGLGLSWDDPGNANSPILCYYDSLSWNQWGEDPFRLTYLFHKGGDIRNEVFPSKEILDYIKSYSESFVAGVLPIKNNSISADLFNDIDDFRKQAGYTAGYNNVNIDADIAWDLFTYSTWYGRPGGIGWFLNPAAMLLLSAVNEAKMQNVGFNKESVPPIVPVESKDIEGVSRDVADRLLIAEKDVADFKKFYNDETQKNRTVFLFRFAVTDYFSREAHIIEYGGGLAGLLDTATAGEAYITEQTAFFDFDIIDFTFNLDGVYTVIPVVASPIDIISDSVPPPMKEDRGLPTWLKLILFAIGLVVLLWILNKVMTLINNTVSIFKK